MKRSLFVMVVAVGAPGLSSVAGAQAPGGAGPVVVGVGVRVRLFAPSIRRDLYVGRIDSMEQGEVVLDTAGVRRRLGFEMGPVLVESFRLVKLRTSAIERVEASGGRTTRSATIKGALLGGIGGGLLIGFGQAPEVNPTFRDFLRGFPIGFAVGFGLGGAVGYALGGERWVAARLPSS